MTTRKNWMLGMTAMVAVGAVMMGAAPASADSRGGWDSRDGRDSPHSYDRHPVVVTRDHHYDRDRSGVTFGFSFGSPRTVVCPPSPVIVAYPPVITTTQTWVQGRYDRQEQQVLVEPAHFETRYTQRVVETRYPQNGPPYTVVIEEGGYKQVWVPDRYETRFVDVYVPGRFVSSTCYPTPVYAQPTVVCPPRETTTRVTIGGVFRF